MLKLKELIFVFLMIPIISSITNNKNEQIESQLKKPFESENRKSDKFVLIGHSETDSNGIGTVNYEDFDRKMRTRKFYQTKDRYNFIDENSKELENEVVATEDDPQNLTYLNPRSGYIYGARPSVPAGNFLGNHGSGYNFGHSYSNGLTGLGGAGLASLGLGGLHLLDPLLLLATLSFVLFLVNSVITLIERLRLPTIQVAGRREFRELDNSTHLTDEILSDIEIFFHNLFEDFDSKYKKRINITGE